MGRIVMQAQGRAQNQGKGVSTSLQEYEERGGG